MNIRFLRKFSKQSNRQSKAFIFLLSSDLYSDISRHLMECSLLLEITEENAMTPSLSQVQYFNLSLETCLEAVDHVPYMILK